MSEHSAEHHVSPPLFYFKTWVVLVILLVLTVAVWKIPLDNHWTWWLPAFALLAALTIAVIKAVLVVANFMQVRFGTKLIWLWAGLGFLWLVFLGGIITDYMTRYYMFSDGPKFG